MGSGGLEQADWSRRTEAGGLARLLARELRENDLRRGGGERDAQHNVGHAREHDGGGPALAGPEVASAADGGGELCAGEGGEVGPNGGSAQRSGATTTTTLSPKPTQCGARAMATT